MDAEENESYLYRDSTNKELYTHRKSDLIISTIIFSASYFIISIILIMWIILYFNFNVLIDISFTSSLILLCAFLAMYISINGKKAIKNGIFLTTKYLNLYNEKIELSDIIYSEVVEFPASGGILSIKDPDMDKLLVIFIKQKNGKIKEKFIRYNETTDIFQLSDLIRKQIGLTRQYTIRTCGLYMGYHRWRNEVLQNLKKNIKIS